jgi:hypothetical protein
MMFLQDKPPMRTSKIVFFAQLLCYANAAIWLFFGITSLANLREGQGVPILGLGLVAILMLGNAGVFGLVGYGLGKGNRRWYTLALGLVGVNLALTLTDQVGLYDWATLVIDATLLILLLSAWKVFQGGVKA